MKLIVDWMRVLTSESFRFESGRPQEEMEGWLDDENCEMLKIKTCL